MHMMLLDGMPLWGLFMLTLASVMLAVELGYLIGKRHQGQHLDTNPVSTMVGAALGLLAFMLAFTFGMAASRFEMRKELVIDDANAIRTTYLRTYLLEDRKEMDQVRKLMLEYVEIRLNASMHPEQRSFETLARTEQIQNEMWSIGSTLFRKHNASDDVQMLVQSMNDMFDNHNKRMTTAFANRIPGTIWLVLYALLFFSMSSVGYYSGITVSRSRLIAMMLAIAFSAIFLLIGDLDRPNQGFLKISQQAMIDVRNKMDIDAWTATKNEKKEEKGVQGQKPISP